MIKREDAVELARDLLALAGLVVAILMGAALLVGLLVGER
jgi:cysteine synthase